MIAALADLMAAAESNGAGDIALCGSVARGEDTDVSDVDFYVGRFDEGDRLDARRRADALVRQFRSLLAPYSVDVRPLPGWLLGPEHERSMKRDAIPLADLAQAAE